MGIERDGVKIMKIYFAASIRAGRGDVDTYSKIIGHLKNHGEVLTEHIGDKSISSRGENLPVEKIHARDLDFLFSSDVVVAEVSNPSLGVGYELGRAVEHGKKILCLYTPQEGKLLSTMLVGCPQITVKEYNTIEEAKEIIDEFFNKLEDN
jgi:nucleoside 2-deoxyribosyltransferase